MGCDGKKGKGAFEPGRCKISGVLSAYFTRPSRKDGSHDLCFGNATDLSGLFFFFLDAVFWF